MGALPLLSYTLDDMWRAMLKAGDGVLGFLRNPSSLAACWSIAPTVSRRAPGAEDALRRMLTLKLATVREDGEPTRRRVFRTEFSDEEWRLVSELSGYPNRLLVTATTEAGETYAEVAHEAIFRRWGKLKEWIAAEREFLAWRSGLEAARRAWEKTADTERNDALLMGFALTSPRAGSPSASATFGKPIRGSLSRASRRKGGVVVVVVAVG